MSAPPRRALLPFVAMVLALWAALLVAWYLAAPAISTPTAWVAARIAEAPAAIERVRASRSGREVVYEVEPDHETARRNRLGRNDVVDVTVNPLKHTFGLPFFLALLLASRPRGLAWKAVLGSAALLALAAAGLACDLLMQVGRMAGFGGEALFMLGGREVIALGYQLGTLMFPTVVPAVLWVALDREALRPYFP
jgi:hypothetical protein